MVKNGPHSKQEPEPKCRHTRHTTQNARVVDTVCISRPRRGWGSGGWCGVRQVRGHGMTEGGQVPRKYKQINLCVGVSTHLEEARRRGGWCGVQWGDEARGKGTVCLEMSKQKQKNIKKKGAYSTDRQAQWPGRWHSWDGGLMQHAVGGVSMKVTRGHTAWGMGMRTSVSKWKQYEKQELT